MKGELVKTLVFKMKKIHSEGYIYQYLIGLVYILIVVASFIDGNVIKDLFHLFILVFISIGLLLYTVIIYNKYSEKVISYFKLTDKDGQPYYLYNIFIKYFFI